MLLQIVRQPDDDGMRRLAKEIASRGLTRDDAREVRRQEMGPRITSGADTKPFIFKYVSPAREFSLELRFRRARVAPEDIAAALISAAESVGSDNGDGD
jgi:hypothetical protein